MDSSVGIITGIAKAFSEGGVWMFAILGVQIASIAIIAERVYVLFLQKSKDQKGIAKMFEDDIRNGRIDKAVNKARGLSRSQPIAAVILAGTQAAQDMGGREEIQAKMDEILAFENSKLERRTGFLSMLGNVGTLLGLLGTIVGLIQAFAAVANLNAVEKSVTLTKGVALAMNTTAYGLIMAIPALVMYAVLMNRTNHLQEDLNQAAFKVFNWLSFNYQAIPSRPSRPNKSV
ncbi:MAG: MotA/TolQ/ExbB proton channel family protein [Bdellovibrionales bacterium]|nr:MotA/TolQ/ExbB proton channel family protein [Bdellovibrionales bacterium]